MLARLVFVNFPLAPSAQGHPASVPEHHPLPYYCLVLARLYERLEMGVTVPIENTKKRKGSYRVSTDSVGVTVSRGPASVMCGPSFPGYLSLNVLNPESPSTTSQLYVNGVYSLC